MPLYTLEKKGGCPSFARGANRFAELIFQSTSLVNIAGYNLTWNGVSNLIELFYIDDI